MPYRYKQPGDWKTRRAKVLRRDGNRCVMCGEPAAHVDHVVNEAEGGSHELDNLQSLCATCHDHKTTAERQRGRHRATQQRQASARRTTEQHPGAL